MNKGCNIWMHFLCFFQGSLQGFFLTIFNIYIYNMYKLQQHYIVLPNNKVIYPYCILYMTDEQTIV